MTIPAFAEYRGMIIRNAIFSRLNHCTGLFSAAYPELMARYPADQFGFMAVFYGLKRTGFCMERGGLFCELIRRTVFELGCVRV